MRNVMTLRGKPIVTRDEGAQLGIISGILVDQAVGRIAGLYFHKRWKKNTQFVKSSDIISVGRDFIVITSETKVQENGQSGHILSDYRNCWVTTLSGNHLGRLADVGTRDDDWAIEQLTIENGGFIQIDGTELVLGDDEILVPNHFAVQVPTGSDSSAGLGIGRFFRKLMGRPALPSSKQKKQPEHTVTPTDATTDKRKPTHGEIS